MSNKRLTLREAGDLVGVTDETVRDWIRRGLVPGVRVGLRRIYVNKSDIEAMIQEV